MGIPVCFICVIRKPRPKESITSPPVNTFACKTAFCLGGCHVHLLSLVSHREKQLLLTPNSIRLLLIFILSGKLLCITDSSKHLHIHRAPVHRLYSANRAVPHCLDAPCCWLIVFLPGELHFHLPHRCRPSQKRTISKQVVEFLHRSSITLIATERYQQKEKH